MSHVEASDLFALMHGSHPLVLIRPAPRVAKLNERMPCSAGVPCANMRSEQNQFHTRPPEAKAAGTVIVLSDKNAPAPGSAAGSAPAPGSAAASACSREQGDLARLQQGDLVLFLLWLAACGRFSTLQKATLWLRCQAPLLSGSGAGWMHRGPNAAQ